MKILVCDSLGVRSLAAVDGNLIIDPGASLGPKRFRLPPHQLEEQKLQDSRHMIREELAEADRVVVSHYHYDHYRRDGDYSGKDVYLKDWENHINKSQAGRAKTFLDHLENQGAIIHRADGQDFGDVEFSPAFPHGEKGSRLGYVVFTRVGDVIHASDAQGPQSDEAVEWILEREPRLLIVSGPPTYLMGWRVSYDVLDKVNENLKRLESVDTIVMDHHLVRDKHCFKRLDEPGRVETGAEFMGKDNLFLEAFRRELHDGADLQRIEELSAKVRL